MCTQVPTLLEVLKLVRDARDKGSKVGLYIETKSPTYHKEHGRYGVSVPVQKNYIQPT